MKKLGPFKFDMVEDAAEAGKLQDYGPYELENNSVYIG